MRATDQAIAILNDLLRGELAATQTYDQALERVEQDSVRATLRHLRVDHHQAVLTLQEHIRSLGGEPNSQAGSWGPGRPPEGAPALRGLRQAEEGSVASYEKAAEQNELPPECRALIRTALLPQCRTHVATLDKMLGG